MFSFNYFNKKKKEVKSKHQEKPNLSRKKEEENQIQEQIKNIHPGCKLYHRATYIRDNENSFGEITVKSFDGEVIVCNTKKGEKRFNISALGRYLFLNETDMSDKVIINGESEIPEEELKNYKQYDKNDRIFNEEKAFFDNIKLKLEKKYRTLLDNAQSQKYGLNDLSDSHKDAFHAFSAYATEATATLEKINRPYFGRVNLSKFNLQTIYIGESALPEISSIVYDWREPVCQIYYTKNLILYDKYGLELIRKFDIYKGSFCGYFDSYIKSESITNDYEKEIVDDFLLTVIKKQRENPKIHDIIQTIQNTQYRIISDELDKNLIIQGCAGSGKTMVLMHRLSYAVYNKKGLERKNIKIITPNINLNLELTDIAQKLQLVDVDRCTLNEYYSQLIKKYCQKNKIFAIPNLQSSQSKSTLFTDDELTVKQLNVLYNIDFGYEFEKFEIAQNELLYLSKFVNEFSSYGKDLVYDSRSTLLKEFDNQLKDLSNMLKETKRILNINEKLSFDNEITKRRHELEVIVNEFRNNINLAVQEIENYIKENAQTLRPKSDVKVAESLLVKFNDIKNVFGSDELYIKVENLVISDRENKYIEDRNYLGMKPINRQLYKDKSGHKIETVITPIDYYRKNIREKRNRFIQMHSLLSKIKLYIESLKQSSNSPKIGSKIINDFMNRFNDLTSIIESLRNFLNKKDNSYITYIWKVYMDQLKSINNISVNKRYQFELYALLLFLYHKFGVVDNVDQYLFIDEGQDFLEIELSILALVNNNPTINIFGDYAQRTRNINKKYFFDVVKEKNFKKYELEVNYRNSKEITEHINTICNKNMISVGLKGLVNRIKFKHLTSNVFEDLTGRRVLIIKGEEALTILREKVKMLTGPRLNIILSNEINFSDSKLNVLNIKSAKGLEFKEVVVFDYKLTNNELYIACSRALEKLTIIES